MTSREYAVFFEGVKFGRAACSNEIHELIDKTAPISELLKDNEARGERNGLVNAANRIVEGDVYP